jgi:single-stranded-DNA-specific exonuclease
LNQQREYRWVIAAEPDAEIIKRLMNEIHISETIAVLLFHRGITTYEDAKKYFRPSLADLHNPFLMDGMERAVQRVLTALEQREKIFVFGDYDVDGTNATSMLYLFLKKLGADVQYSVPNRVLEGYGISVAGIQKAKELGTSLFISVDCGITAIEQIDYANSLGIDVIICDHHEPGETLPNAYALLDPLKPTCNYPFKYLCGCGVAFKFMQGILQRKLNNIFERESVLREYLDFVVLATSADIVPITGENRTLLKIGLEQFNRSPRVGIRALITSAGLKLGRISVGQIVFVLAPRINAVGRMGDAHRAIHLLTCENEQQASELAAVLEKENIARRKIDEETFLEAQTVAESFLQSNNPAVLVLHQEHWHPGVIGIVASRIVEKYYKPTIMLTSVEGKVKGSARSVDGFDIYTALTQVEDRLLSFGGHKYAAGVLLETHRIDDFREALSKTVNDLMTDEHRTPGIKIERSISLSELNPKFFRILDQFSPYGPQNMRPTLLAKGVTVYGAPRLVGKGHLRWKVKEAANGTNTYFDAIGFGLGDRIEQLSHNTNIDIVFSLDEYAESNFSSNGSEYVPQLRVKDFRLSA